MPTVSSIFCTRCGSSTPFAGLPDERRVQSARCPPCTTAVRRGEDKWITRNGETRHCASCGIGFPARSKYARCQPCRTQDQTTLPALFTISSTPRVCDTCSNVLPQYEQSRRVCHRCRRRQVSQRSTANTPLPTPIETPLPMLIHAPSSPFRPIVPSPSSRPPATPMTPGRQTFPSPGLEYLEHQCRPLRYVVATHVAFAFHCPFEGTGSVVPVGQLTSVYVDGGGPTWLSVQFRDT
ncbi:hypothetical protein PDIDSM_134 [Penicillium digitatum]|nr:hypothetical protein PDIDSM_134 [Penicillium digitatum]